jgi:CheY-like chemotaxis protein
VLVVDDEQHLGSAIARATAPVHRVVVTHDGGEALRVLADDSAFDAILCDVMMPIIDGPRFHAALTEAHPALADPVVLLTGQAFTPRARAFLPAVPNRVLSTPVRIEAVVAARALVAGPPKCDPW